MYNLMGRGEVKECPPYEDAINMTNLVYPIHNGQNKI